MSSIPLVSVVLPVWNDARWLEDAALSMLRQSHARLELIAVDDGSADETPALLEGLARQDARVRVERQEHAGLSRALNRGLELARGELVARLDADDLCHPDRLSRQLAFLREHPEVGIVGTAVEKIDEEGRVIGRTPRPETDLELRFKALLWCPFTHSAVLVRHALLEEHGLRYDESLPGSEDYELWTRLLEHTLGANLFEPLVRYRVRDGMSTRHREPLERVATGIALRTVRAWVPNFETNHNEVEGLRTHFSGMGRARVESDPAGLALAARYLDLLEAFVASHGEASERRELAESEAERFLHALSPRLGETGWRDLAIRLDHMAPGFRRRHRVRWEAQLRHDILRRPTQARYADLWDSALGLAQRMGVLR